jgi:molecular chaperone DnaK (HSP70)
MGKMIGIDLGTTNSVAAIADGPQPRVLDSREARSQTRSVVGLKKRKVKGGGETAELLVGDAAMDNWALAPRDTIVSVKRLMGRGSNDPEVAKVRTWALYEIREPSDGTGESLRVVLGGKEYSPVDVSALILKKIKEDAEFRLGEAVTHAVITVPAYFSQIQRDATRKAGLKAGLKPIKILEEPTAAAIAFGLEAGDGTPKTVLVYDLGGGTFDISVLMWAGNIFAPLNLEGDMWLGGDNLDQALVDHVLAHVDREHGLDPRGNARFMAELKKSAQSVKERLSSSASADLVMAGMLQDDAGNLVDVEMEITRDEFDRMILPLVGRYRACACGAANHAREESCAGCGASLRAVPVQDGRALELVKKALAHPNVNMQPSQVDFVLMAGNATTVPLVQQTMEEMFGKEKVLRRVHPKQSVALGAAMVAAWMGEKMVCLAPDPEDRGRECGHVNVEHAKACARCGASLTLEETITPGETRKMGRPDIGSIGGIAPFDYGAQTAGDQFQVFVRKGDPFPTQEAVAQVFRTRVARQRMISIPIFGGDHHDRASANERQGEAFAVLPSDLPAGTPVRVKLWLNSDGIFELSAHLDDGRDLQAWTVHGEQDAKAIEAIENVERVVGEQAQGMTPELAREVEQARSRAFDKLRKRDFNGAREEAERLEQRMKQAPAEAQGDVRKRAKGLLGWTDFVLQQYGWAFHPDDAQRISKLAEDTRAALGSRNDQLVGERLAALDEGTSYLPKLVNVLLGIRHAITARIRTADPNRSAAMLRRLEDLEQAIRADRPGAGDALAALRGDVDAALDEVEGRRVVRCTRGHEVPAGSRYCPACEEDTWALDARPAAEPRR